MKRYSAVIFWKSQSPWPALRGGFYDYYLETTGGFWGVRAAAAEAVHLQLNQDSRTLAVISRKFAPSQHPASATATFLDLRTGAPVGEVIRCKPVVIAPNAVTDLGCEAAWPAGHEGTLLLRLALTVNERVVRCAFPETLVFNGLFLRNYKKQNDHLARQARDKNTKEHVTSKTVACAARTSTGSRRRELLRRRRPGRNSVRGRRWQSRCTSLSLPPLLQRRRRP